MGGGGRGVNPIGQPDRFITVFFFDDFPKHPAKLEPNFLKVDLASQSRLDPEAGEAALLPVSVEEAVLEGRPGPEVNLIIFFHPKAIVIPTLIGSHASGGGRNRRSLARSEYLWQ